MENGTVENDKNKHVKDFLDYYLNFSREPKYAVMLNGAWGTGKTFLIK